MSFSKKLATILVALMGAPLFTSASVDCSGSCYIGDTGGAEDAMFGWIRDDQVVSAGFDPLYSTDMALTIVTIINTVLDTTTTSTEYGPDYIPPLTNADGTRIEEITYTRNGEVSTTVLTYPSFFAVWPDDYTWGGQIQLTDSNGDPTSCLSAPTDGFVVTILETSQPTGAALDSSLFAAMGVTTIDTALDPQGLSYHLASDKGAQWALTVLSDMFPGAAELKSCQVESPGPNWGQFTSTQWTTHSTTQYTDGGSVAESMMPSATVESTTTSTTTAIETMFSETNQAPTSPATSFAPASETTSSSEETFASSSTPEPSSSSEETSAAGGTTTGHSPATSSSTSQSTTSAQTVVTASAAALTWKVQWISLVWASLILWHGL